jgi:type IV pilus assembly protein PilF
MKWTGLAILVLLAVTACASDTEREESAAKFANRVKIHADLGASYLMHNKLDVAQQELERALELDPDDSQANNFMALLQIRLKNDDKADQHFRRAIREQPDNSEARNNYAVFLCERNRFEDADQQFRTAIQNPLYKSVDQGNVNAGLCRLRAGDKNGAATFFRAALKSNPRQVTALYQLARLSFESGEMLSARGFMQRYFEVSKDTPESLLLAFRIERALNAKDTQAKYALRLRGKFPESAEAKQLRTLTGH